MTRQKHFFRRLGGKRFRRWLAALGAGGLCVLALLLNSCASFTEPMVVPPEIPGAVFAGNKACHDCHANIVRKFPASPHARVRFENTQMKGEAGCESCHGPGSKHIAAGGGRKFILNPGKDPGECFRCHLETHAEFNLPQHHPVVEGRMNCVQCHDPHGADILKPAGGLAMSRLNEACAPCHREQAKPFVFEHAAMREGCTVCHNPHGSINAKLLVERDNNLCLKCHAMQQSTFVGAGQIFIGRVDHSAKLRLGGCWSAGCHTAVHGSNFNHHKLY